MKNYYIPEAELLPFAPSDLIASSGDIFDPLVDDYTQKTDNITAKSFFAED